MTIVRSLTAFSRIQQIPFLLVASIVLSSLLWSYWFASIDAPTLCPPCIQSVGDLQLHSVSKSWYLDPVPQIIHRVIDSSDSSYESRSFRRFDNLNVPCQLQHDQHQYQEQHNNSFINSVATDTWSSWRVTYHDWKLFTWDLATTSTGKTKSVHRFVQKNFPVYWTIFKDLPKDRQLQIVKYFILFELGGIFVDHRLQSVESFEAHLLFGKVQLMQPMNITTVHRDNNDVSLDHRIMISPARHPFWHYVFYEVLAYPGGHEIDASLILTSAASLAPDNMIHVFNKLQSPFLSVQDHRLPSEINQIFLQSIC